MNREALDDFFARADDVLTDWQPSDDAMVARVPDDDTDPDLAPAGDSYYSQGWAGDGWLEIGLLDETRPWRDVWQPIYERAFAHMVLYGQSFVQVSPQGIVTLPIAGASPLMVWRDEVFAYSTAVHVEAEPEAAATVADFERYWLAEQCDETPPPPEIVLPWLPDDVWERCIARVPERNNGPATRYGLDGRRRR